MHIHKTIKQILCWKVLFLSLFFSSIGHASEQKYPTIFFNADHSGFTRDGKKQFFKGDVTGFVSGIIFGADELQIDKEKNILEASGHVLLLDKSQVFIGDFLTYDLNSKKFIVSGAILVTEGERESQDILRKVFRLSEKEKNFETYRNYQLSSLQTAKEKLKEEFRHSVSKEEEFTEAYLVLLEKEKLISSQENIVLRNMNDEKKKDLLTRRQYWEDSKRSASLTAGNEIPQMGFFQLKGETIHRTSAFEVNAFNARLTPCKCALDETPSWAFRAGMIETTKGGYANLYDPVIEISGIPIFYFPYFKVPMKNTRQSGFLFPNFGFTSNNGTMFSQPFYYALGDEKDATVNFDYIQKRGYRAGFEYRHELTDSSGWTFNIEGMRDKVWLEHQANRRSLKQAFVTGLTQARGGFEENSHHEILTADKDLAMSQMGNPVWWKNNGLGACLEEGGFENCVKNKINQPLLMPTNSWRGSFRWNGQTFFSPRLSLASEGHFDSDHRYVQDLFIPADFFSPGSNPILFSRSRAQLHYDDPNYYVGLTSSFGDDFTAPSLYFGQQLPAVFNVKTRIFSLVDRWLPNPLYGSLGFTHRAIYDHVDGMSFESVDPAYNRVTLGQGAWNRFKLNLVSPLITEGLFTADFFSDLEFRIISSHPKFVYHSYEDKNLDPMIAKESQGYSTIKSMKLGVNFNLPLEGSMVFSSNDEGAGDNVERVLHHKMNWQVTFSSRPFVYRHGNYGTLYSLYEKNSNEFKERGYQLTYFESDNHLNVGNEFVPETESMFPHQKIIFSTAQSWLLNSHKWVRTDGALPSESSSLRERARAELMQTLDRSVGDYNEMYNGTSWLINRYEKKFYEGWEPVTFDAAIDYDFVKEQAREKKILENIYDNLPEPWSPLTSRVQVRMLSLELTALSQFNVYKKIATNLTLNLIFPSVFSTQLGLSHVIDNRVTILNHGSFKTSQMKTSEIGLTSSLIPSVVITTSYGLKFEEAEGIRIGDKQMMASAGMTYSASSECWGLKFFWKKDYNQKEWLGAYYIALVVNFFNFNKEFTNVMLQ